MNGIKKMVLGSALLLTASFSFASHAVLLVSLGMPDNALKAYLKQAHQYRIPLVIRGLYTDQRNESDNPYIGSFKDTAHRVKQLIQTNKVGGVSINPLLFRAFSIKAVPALVVYDDALSCIQQAAHAPQAECDHTHYDVIVGNIPMDKQLTLIADQSLSEERANFSRHRLKKKYQKGKIE